ncbi:hypothetical protein RRG08_032170 [Elysia crispata]|uniref:Uncharacterized protein n=1 Tax=Elysia crispata TaxID=231223 RepID=A0AAE1ABV6_9GAST|nr:hypothetical protein RRG08_032170 [Elysia crispata]
MKRQALSCFSCPVNSNLEAVRSRQPSALEARDYQRGELTLNWPSRGARRAESGGSTSLILPPRSGSQLPPGAEDTQQGAGTWEQRTQMGGQPDVVTHSLQETDSSGT